MTRAPRYPSRMTKRIGRLIGALTAVTGVGYGAIMLYMYLAQDRLVYVAQRGVVETPTHRGVAYEDVWLTADDHVRVHGWFVPADKPRATLLYFHGNAGNISGRLEAIMLYRRLGLNVFIIDYRGYGKSEGEPSEAGMYRDAEAAWRYLTDARGIAPQQIVIYGRSLGGGVASHLAAQHRAGALVLESSFTSLHDAAAGVYPWLPVHWLLRYRYPVQENLARVAIPVLIMHSRADELIPFAHGERLYAAAAEPKRFFEIGGTHNEGFFADRASYVQGLDAFLRAALH